MKRYIQILTICLTLNFACLNISAQEQTQISISKSEKWWGVYVFNAPSEPFAKPFSITTNLYNRDGSFTSALMLSSKGRYIWSEDQSKISFDEENITITAPQKLKAEKGGRNLREAYLVWVHKNFPPTNDVVSKKLITQPVYETRYELGYQQTQQGVLEYADRILQEGLPSGVIVLCAGWASLNSAVDFNKEIYPDPRAMVDQLHAKGFSVMLKFTPLIAPVGIKYMNLAKQDMLLKKEDGSVLIVEGDAGFNACIDIRKGNLAEQMKADVDKLRAQYGVDGFRYDASAVLTHLKAGTERDKYMQLWLSLGGASEFEEFMPGDFDRKSSHVNCFVEKGALNWSRLNTRVNNVISAGLCGYSYSHPLMSDAQIDGILNDQRLMAYYLQLSAFMPVCSVDFAPWRIEDKSLRDKVTQMLVLRANSYDFLSSTIDEMLKTAEPLVRNLEYQFPRLGFADCNDQFMFSDKYLVVVPDAKADTKLVRLPKGMWKKDNGQVLKGPLVTTVDVSDGKIVYFELTK